MDVVQALILLATMSAEAANHRLPKIHKLPESGVVLIRYSQHQRLHCPRSRIGVLEPENRHRIELIEAARIVMQIRARSSQSKTGRSLHL